jgi:hypothetical protein
MGISTLVVYYSFQKENSKERWPEENAGKRWSELAFRLEQS